MRAVSLILILVFTLSGVPPAQATDALGSWVRIEGIDFSKQGVLFGQVIVDGHQADKWKVVGSVTDLNTGETERFQQGAEGFFLPLTPGRYQLHVSHLLQYVERIYEGGKKKIKLNHWSQTYEVKAGEAIYVGDLKVNLSKPEGYSLKKPGRLIGFALGGTKRNLEVVTKVTDHSTQKQELLTNQRPEQDYQYTFQPFEFAKQIS